MTKNTRTILALILALSLSATSAAFAGSDCDEKKENKTQEASLESQNVNRKTASDDNEPELRRPYQHVGILEKR